MQQYNNLIIDPEVSALFLPPDSAAINKIRENIRLGIAPAPFPVWNRTLMDRIHEYIEYADAGFDIRTQPFTFRSKNMMLASICQLLAEDIPKHTQYKIYLIGKQYQYHKAAFDHKDIDSPTEHIRPDELKKRYTKDIHPSVVALVDLYDVSAGTIHFYSRYANAVDTIRSISPKLALSILSGEINVSRKAILRLNSLSEDELKKCIEKLVSGHDTRILSSMIPGHAPVKIYEPPHLDNRIIPEIKQMPKYDPDGYVSSLALTIPSWSDTIKRVRERSNMKEVSLGAAKKLIFQLGILERNIQIIKTELEGVTKDAN